MAKHVVLGKVTTEGSNSRTGDGYRYVVNYQPTAINFNLHKRQCSVAVTNVLFLLEIFDRILLTFNGSHPLELGLLLLDHA